VRAATLPLAGKLLIASVLCLNAIGLVFIHSATADGEDFPSRLARGQIIRAGLGLAGLWLITRLDYRLLDRYAHAIYGGLAAILAAMLAVRVLHGGAHRHLQLHLFQVQPSELMKLGLVIGLARYLRFREDQGQAGGLAGPFLLTLGPMALVLLQPDLGTSLMFPPVLLAMLFVAGARLRHLVLATALGLAILPAVHFLGDRVPFIRPYQRDRLTAFLRRDSSTARLQGFHLRQSEIAIGSGGALGKGIGEGTQNVLGHLREKHTDFIFGVVGEETGFAGASAVTLLAFLVPALILGVAIRTREPFGRLVATGIAAAFAAQSFQNIGMTMGLTPITGVPLPFVSQGGSSLVASYLSIGVVIGIASRRVRVVAPRDLDPAAGRRAIAVDEARPSGLLESRWPVG
jgi:rod shape determining protein RodA